LLTNILRSHESVFSAIGETKFFDAMPMIRRTYPDLWDERQFESFVRMLARIVLERKYNVARAVAGGQISHMPERQPETEIPADVIQRVMQRTEGRSYGEVIRLMFEELTVAAGKKRWMEESPNHIFHIEEIVGFVPEARFVEIVRDPRDVLASKKTRRASVWTDRYSAAKQRMKHLEKAYDPLWDALSWKSAVKAGELARERYGDQMHLIRYEDLVTDPSEVIKRTCDFLDMTFSPQMLEVEWANPAEWSRTGRAGVGSESVGRWEAKLGPAELALCQWLTKSQMSHLRYAPATTKRRSLLKLPVLLGSSVFEIFQRLYRRWRFGGMAFVKNIVMRYLNRAGKL
ncbi:MAG TPA: sulfotransferase, partial [Candidatus Paceibacterota bacterium]|nr:sulfotransferase [Candidatus Paceibacterota bacterium]